jgi:hypothetical protein
MSVAVANKSNNLANGSYNQLKIEYRIKEIEEQINKQILLDDEQLKLNRERNFLYSKLQESIVFAEINRDRIYEYFAHDIGYKDELDSKTNKHIHRLGFIPSPLIEGEFGLQARVFYPNEQGRKRGHIPILSFRGTLEFKDVLTDLDKEGVGWGQFSKNLRLIHQQQVKKLGIFDVTGHSLGGALAQMTAATFPTSVRRVVTFQSPGIPASMLSKLQRYTELSGRNIQGTHYRAAHDVVDNVGEGHIPGVVYELNYDEVPETDAEDQSTNSELGLAAISHTSYPIKNIKELNDRRQNDISKVKVTRRKTSAPNQDRLMETFRREVLGIEHPENYTNLDSADELLDQAIKLKKKEVLPYRMNFWMHNYSSRLGELEQNTIFLLLETIQWIYTGSERIYMWIWVLNSVPESMCTALHRRLMERIYPAGFSKENYERIKNYLSK